MSRRCGAFAVEWRNPPPCSVSSRCTLYGTNRERERGGRGVHSLFSFPPSDDDDDKHKRELPPYARELCALRNCFPWTTRGPHWGFRLQHGRIVRRGATESTSHVCDDEQSRESQLSDAHSQVVWILMLTPRFAGFTPRGRHERLGLSLVRNDGEKKKKTYKG